jgi:benzoyl-CoA reductase/2-hydroxyglutaryl-CoA dehydratase subunit BcrC/BadD/HgdB
MRLRTAAAVLLILWGAMGCQNAYYKVWQKLGWEKRDILIDRVEDARDEQEAAKEQFKTTLERFQELTNFKGGELESKYRKLNSEYERSKERAQAVTDRINAVDQVANDLFDEWETELKEYDDRELRKSSEEKLRQSRERYKQLLAAMRKSEASMQPVLKAFGNQVLYLKHSLNAQAVASLEATADEIRDDVQQLIKEMEASIAEANAFIGELKG